MNKIMLLLFCMLLPLIVKAQDTIKPVWTTLPIGCGAAYHPDGKTFCTWGGANAMIWDALSTKPLFYLTGHKNDIYTAQYSANGSKLLTCGSENAYLWNTADGSLIASIPAPNPGFIVNSAHFNASGDKFILASTDGMAVIYSAANATPTDTLGRHSTALRDALFAPSGDTVIAVGADSLLWVWSLSPRKLLTEIRISGPRASSAQVVLAQSNSLGLKIITTSGDSLVWIRSPRDGTAEYYFSHRQEITALHVYNDTMLISGDISGELQIHNLKSRNTWQIGRNTPANPITSITYNPSSKTIFTTASDGVATAWTPDSLSPVYGMPGAAIAIYSAAISPDGNRIIVSALNGEARIFQGGKGTIVDSLFGHSSTVERVRSNTAGNRIVSASWDYSSKIWDPYTGKCLQILRTPHNGTVWDASFDPGGKRIITSSFDGSGKIYEVTTGLQLRALNTTSREANSGAFDPTGTKVLMAYRDGSAIIWDAAAGQTISRFIGHQNEVVAAAFNKTGDKIVTASGDRTARIWNASTGSQQSLLQCDEYVGIAQFNPAGTIVATGSSDKKMRLWNASTGALLFTSASHLGYVRYVNWSEDGRYLLSGSDGGDVRMWSGDTLLLNLKGHGWGANPHFTKDQSLICVGHDEPSIRIWYADDGEPAAILSGNIKARFRHLALAANDSILIGASQDGVLQAWNIASLKNLRIRQKSNLSGTVCKGGYYTVQPTLRNAKGTITWQWQRADGTALGSEKKLGGSSTDDYVVLADTITRSYLVIAKDSLGNQDSALFTLTVDPAKTAPQPTIKGSTKVCSTDSNVLYSTDSVPGDLYQWEILQGNGFISSSDTNSSVQITFLGADTMILELAQTNPQGCIGFAQKMIIPGTNLDINISSKNGKSTFCTGDSLILVPDIDNVEYTWTKDGQNIGSTKDLTVKNAGNYRLSVVKKGAGCSGISQIFAVTELSLPQPEIIGNQALCAGLKNVPYTLKNKSAGSSYTWTILNGPALILSGNTADTAFLEINGKGTVKVQVQEINKANCIGSAEFVINVDSVIKPVLSTSNGRNSFCAGDTVVIDAGNFPGFDYQWIIDGIIRNFNTPKVQITQPGKILVKIISTQTGCTGISDTLTLQMNTAPSLNLQQKDSVLEIISGIVPDSIQWLDEKQNIIPGANSTVFAPAISGTYFVRVWLNGCQSTASTGFTKTLSGDSISLILLDYDFGNQVVSSILNDRGGHRGTIKIINKGIAKAIADSLFIDDRQTVFGIIPGQFPREIEAGDTSEIAISFRPQAFISYQSPIQLLYGATRTARAIVRGNGRPLENGSTITEIILSPSTRELYPGDTLQVCLKIGIQEPNQTKARDFKSVIDYDRRVLEFIADDNVTPRKSPDKRDRRLLEIEGSRQENQPVLGCIRFIAKQGEADYTSILFNGGDKSFVWTDGEGRVYPAYSDSLVRIILCQEGGTQFVKRAPRKTQLLSVAVKAFQAKVQYFQKAGDMPQMLITDLYGRIHSIKQIHSVSTDTEGFTEIEIPGHGVYLIILRGSTGSSVEKIIIAG
jgi:WD40 repeat protein